MTSLPSWERGLKWLVGSNRHYPDVAPLVGAWIEISWQYFAVIRSAGVAPLVGAWIEIRIMSKILI